MADFLKSLKVKGVEIDTAGATTNQVLTYNGTKFAPASAAGGVGAAATPATLGSVYGQTPFYSQGGYQMGVPMSGVNFSWGTPTRTFQTSSNLTSVFPSIQMSDLYVGRSITINANDIFYNIYLSWMGTIASTTSNSITLSAVGFMDMGFGTGGFGSDTGDASLILTETDGNLSYGYNALSTVLSNLSTSRHNIAIGPQALKEVDSSEGNIAIGKNAMYYGYLTPPQSWYNNIAIGVNSGQQLPNNTQGSVILGGHQGYDVTNNTVLLSDGYGTEVARFNPSNFTVKYQTEFSAYRSTNYSYQNNTEVVPIIFNATTRNVNSRYNVSNGRFTAPVTGRYWFNASVWTSSGAVPYHVWIIKNGVRSLTIAHNDDDWIATGGTFMFLNANDWVAIGAGMGGPSGVGTIAGSQINNYFTGCLVH